VPEELSLKVNPTKLSCPIIYYNNFHVARVKLWSDPLITHYFDRVERSGGIYHFRWGDAALHTIAIMTNPQLKLGRFDFCYSKRYEREQGAYVNTDHQIAKQYFDIESLNSRAARTGSMTDFVSFNRLLATRGIGDIATSLTKLHVTCDTERE
jgi:hypothetical protein